MDDEIITLLRAAGLAVAPGMLTSAGRVLAVGMGTATVWDGAAVTDVLSSGVVPDLTDRATVLLCLEELGRRTGLNPEGGLLWHLDEDPVGGGQSWVLEDEDEVRTRDGDTDDPLLSLARALVETAPGGD